MPTTHRSNVKNETMHKTGNFHERSNGFHNACDNEILNKKNRPSYDAAYLSQTKTSFGRYEKAATTQRNNEKGKSNHSKSTALFGEPASHAKSQSFSARPHRNTIKQNAKTIDVAVLSDHSLCRKVFQVL